MFGSKKRTPEDRPPINPKVRSSIYALAALYLAYLLYQIVWPYLTGDPYGPSTLMFVLGIAVLGGGILFLGLMAWKMSRAPLPSSEDPDDTASNSPEELPGTEGSGGEDDAL